MRKFLAFLSVVGLVVSLVSIMREGNAAAPRLGHPLSLHEMSIIQGAGYNCNTGACALPNGSQNCEDYIWIFYPRSDYTYYNPGMVCGADSLPTSYCNAPTSTWCTELFTHDGSGCTGKQIGTPDETDVAFCSGGTNTKPTH